MNLPNPIVTSSSSTSATSPGNPGADIASRLHSPVSQWVEAMAGLARGLRVALPGIVVSFDATKQTVVVQPAISEMERIGGKLTEVKLPPLVDLPVVLPRAGGYTLTMPIAAGDECLVVFADSCIDAWWQQGGQQPQFERRRHTLADGFALVGVWSQPRVLTNYSTTSAQLRNDAGTVKVDLAASQVTVTASTIQVNATQTATVSAPTVNVQATNTASVQAPTVNVAGSTAVNITGGHCSIDGKPFLTHTHSGVASGGSVSGPVV